MLLLTLDSRDDFVQLGDDIRIYFYHHTGRYVPKKVRIKIDAPKEVKILRKRVLDKMEAEVK